MVASDIINLILQRYKMLCVKYPQSTSFIPNTKGDSFYLIRNRGEGLQPTQIRLSNHGTYLETWCDRNELGDSVGRLNPAFCVNISIVFVDEGEDLTKDCKGMPNCDGCEIEPCKPQTFEGQDELGRPFTVMQYVYNSRCIRRKYINGLTKAIMEASINGKYKDPLEDLYRAAKKKELKSSTIMPIIKRSKTNKHMENSSKQYPKSLIRLTESDLHKIIKESVNNIVKKMANESIENETRFLPHLKRTYENLYSEYEHWQYAAYKPQGMDDAIDAIIEAMHRIEDIIKGIEPSDDIPTWEDPQQY